MKLKTAALMMATVIIVTLLAGNAAYALSTREVIHLTFRVERPLSLNLNDEVLRQDLHKPEAEAFSELKEKGILVDKLKKGDSTVWLFTKTE